MTIRIPLVMDYNGKGAKKAQADLAALAKQYAKNALSAGAVYEVAKRSIMAANEDAASQKQLAIALRNSAGANDFAVAKAEDFIGKMQYEAAVADDKLRPALATLAGVTHDATKAQDLLKVALDVSAAKGVDLETASLALSKAYQGNVGALRRMGLAISDTAIKNKDFGQALAEIKMQTEGAAKAAASGSEGGWKKLALVVGDLSEALGYSLNKQLDGTIRLLDKAGQAVVDSNQKNGWLSKTLNAVGQAFIESTFGVIGYTNALGQNSRAVDKDAEAQKALQSRNNSALALQGQTLRGIQAETEATKKSSAAKSEAALKAEALAKANKDRLASALQTARDKVRAIKDEITSYTKAIADTVSGFLSLDDAYATATASEQAYQDALRDRADAYAELAKLQTTVFDARTGQYQVANAEDLANALERVAQAESNVATAQGKRTDYATQFKDQVAAAKAFSADLQSLQARNLSPAVLQQLLNMGPIAGDAVAKELLAGTSGLSISGLNADFGAIAQAGQTLGWATGMGIYGADLGAAQNMAGQVATAQTINVTVTSADPQAVVDALVKWSKAHGKLPSTIKVS